MLEEDQVGNIPPLRIPLPHSPREVLHLLGPRGGPHERLPVGADLRHDLADLWVGREHEEGPAKEQGVWVSRKKEGQRLQKGSKNAGKTLHHHQRRGRLGGGGGGNRRWKIRRRLRLDGGGKSTDRTLLGACTVASLLLYYTAGAGNIAAEHTRFAPPLRKAGEPRGGRACATLRDRKLRAPYQRTYPTRQEATPLIALPAHHRHHTVQRTPSTLTAVRTRTPCDHPQSTARMGPNEPTTWPCDGRCSNGGGGGVAAAKGRRRR